MDQATLGSVIQSGSLSTQPITTEGTRPVPGSVCGWTRHALSNKHQSLWGPRSNRTQVHEAWTSSPCNGNTVNSLLTDPLVSGQLYLRTFCFSIPVLTSQSNSLLTHSRRRTLSRKLTRTLLNMEFGMFSLFALSRIKRTSPVLHEIDCFDRVTDQWEGSISSRRPFVWHDFRKAFQLVLLAT